VVELRSSKVLKGPSGRSPHAAERRSVIRRRSELRQTPQSSRGSWSHAPRLPAHSRPSPDLDLAPVSLGR
jgi:hypothetical protein